MCLGCMSCLGALFQVTGVNLASVMPDCYTEAVFSGMALSGILASYGLIIALTLKQNNFNITLTTYVLRTTMFLPMTRFVGRITWLFRKSGMNCTSCTILLFIGE